MIQRAGGFVGEQELRLVDERAHDRHALAFAAAQLAGAMMQALAKPDALEQALAPVLHEARAER